MYVIQDLVTGKYRDANSRFGLIDNIDKAKIYRRYTDALSATKNHLNYSVVECHLTPALPLLTSINVGDFKNTSFKKERPSWENYFFGLAVTASKRSHDIHTKVGAVIADRDHHVIGIGYNGFPKGMVDASLPTERPAKYQWMVHAEMNAVTNCLHKPEGCTAYLTLAPCGECAIHMWQNGIREIVYDKTTDCSKKDWFKPDVLNKLRQDTNMVIRGVTPDLGWM